MRKTVIMVKTSIRSLEPMLFLVINSKYVNICSGTAHDSDQGNHIPMLFGKKMTRKYFYVYQKFDIKLALEIYGQISMRTNIRE